MFDVGEIGTGFAIVGVTPPMSSKSAYNSTMANNSNTDIITFISRAGINSKVVICGDLAQIDNKSNTKYDNGLFHAQTKLYNNSPVEASQIFATLSIEAVTTLVPFALYLADSTLSVCPFNTCNSSPFRAFQILASESQEVVKICVPFELN
jgi:hypothetical protein